MVWGQTIVVRRRPASAYPVCSTGGPATANRQLLVSLHDVTPQVLGLVEDLLRVVGAAGYGPVSLLVIPGSGWTSDSVRKLRAWQHEGHVLAAHGFFHKADSPRSAMHRMHSALFSRGVAEHHGPTREELLQIIHRSAAWFDEEKLGIPQTYVPPAWALGPVRLGDFARTPFRRVETLMGIYDVVSRTFRALPLVGFEADTPLRAWALRLSNRINALGAAASGRSLRVAIHPKDAQLLLASDMGEFLEKGMHAPGSACAPVP